MHISISTWSVLNLYTSIITESLLRFRYELHPRVRGPRSIRRVLPLPLANGQQPIPRRAPHPEPRGYVLLGPHLLRALQKEDFLENLTLIPGDVVYITIAGVGI